MAKKTKEASEEQDRWRMREHFLPTWSNYYFEVRKARTYTVSLLLWVVGILLGISAFLVAVYKESSRIAAGGLLLLLVLAAVLFIWKHVVLEKMKEPGTVFGETGTIRTDLFGGEHSVSYAEWTRGIEEHGMQLKSTGIRVRAGREHIEFPFEVGDASMQRHVLELYGEFRERVSTSMPVLTKTSIDLVDHRFFYRRSRRNQLLLLFLTGLFFLLIPATKEMEFVVLGFTIILPIELVTLRKLFCNAQLTQLNADQLKEKLKGTDLIRERERNVGYVTFFTALALLMLFQLFVITVF